LTTNALLVAELEARTTLSAVVVTVGYMAPGGSTRSKDSRSAGARNGRVGVWWNRTWTPASAGFGSDRFDTYRLTH